MILSQSRLHATYNSKAPLSPISVQPVSFRQADIQKPIAREPVVAGLSLADVQAIRKDLSDTIKPSWVTSLPKDLGSKRHGKLKADQWRTVATVFLPTTLIPRWSPAADDVKDGVRLEMLDNTMDLVNAVILATKRAITEQDCESYMKYMSRYLADLKRLYPHLQLRPVHHAALHLGEFLRMYGPVYGWWTFPFERLIGVLQKIETNNKQGDIPIQLASPI